MSAWTDLTLEQHKIQSRLHELGVNIIPLHTVRILVITPSRSITFIRRRNKHCPQAVLYWYLRNDLMTNSFLIWMRHNQPGRNMASVVWFALATVTVREPLPQPCGVATKSPEIWASPKGTMLCSNVTLSRCPNVALKAETRVSMAMRENSREEHK